jgi:protoporphyrinogen oxidase
MGYNPNFRYPKSGGIEIIPRALAKHVDNIRLRERVAGVDLGRRRARLESGEELEYDSLVVTIPLPAFLGMAEGGERELGPLAASLDWSVVGCLNLGIDRADLAGGAHWIYFPDADVPFYRAGFPANFSAGAAPPGTSSMYVEFGLRKGERFDPAAAEQAALEALRREGILSTGDSILARDHVVIDPGYVIFDRARQEIMSELRPRLEEQGVHLIGRYGAWTYSYMERALLDGMELAEKLTQR